MRCPCAVSRSLPLVVACLAVVFVSISITNARKIETMRVERERLLEVSPYALSATKARDQEFYFVVENYGYKYRGMTGNLIDDSILVFGAWEKDILFFIEDYVKAAGLKDTAFVDVGANTGQYTLFMAPRIKEVHAIEPFPPVLKNLHENIALSQFKNVKVHELGFGEKEDTLPFYAEEDWNRGGGTFRAGDADKKLYAKLRVAAGDEYFKTVEMAPVGVLKMDIEGHEEPALKGLRRTMEKDRPLMIVEVSRRPLGTIESLEQLRSLFPANYEFLYFRESQKQSISGKYLVEDFVPVAGDFFGFKMADHYNLVCVPKERLSQVPRSKK